MAISDERLTRIELRAAAAKRGPNVEDAFFLDNAAVDILDLVAELRRVRAVVRGITAEMRSRAEGIAVGLDHDAITNRQAADELLAIANDAAWRLRAAVPVFVKQLGSVAISDSDDDRRFAGDMTLPHPFRIHLSDRKGGDPSEWPEDLRVREWPQVAP